MVLQPKTRFFVETKLNRPPAAAQLVERPQLTAMLCEGADRRLTLISAPAGSGKSTIATQWIESSPSKATWLCLDVHDNDLGTFLGYLIAALGRAWPGFGKRSRRILSSPKMPPAAYVADSLLADLETLEAPTIIVLDEFEAIESEAVHTVLERLIEHLPDRAHVAVLTRQDPPWPLARWRLRGWTCEVRAEHLRFSEREARAFLAPATREPLSDETIETLVAWTEGWVAALQMLRLSISHQQSAEQQVGPIPAANQPIFDFLVEQVLSAQPPAIRDFLALTAPLERFCAPLCDYLLATDAPGSGREAIDSLRSRNLFLVPLDENGEWFRYHHLFREMLLQRSSNLPVPLEPAQLLRRVSEWFADEGLVDEALSYRIRAGDLDGAANLVLEHLQSAIDAEPSRRTLGRWLGEFPAGAERGRPGLLIAHAHMKIPQSDLRGLKHLLDETEETLRDQEDRLPASIAIGIRADLDAMRGLVSFWGQDLERALEHARCATQTAPKPHRVARSLGNLYTCLSLHFTGRADEAVQTLRKATVAETAEGGRYTADLLMTRALLAAVRTEVDEQLESARQILEIPPNLETSDYFRGYAEYFLGAGFYERNHLDAAAKHFDRVRKLRYRVNPRVYHDALIGLSLIALAKSDLIRARNCAAEAREFAIEAGDPTAVAASDTHEARLAVATGRAVLTVAQPQPRDAMLYFLEVPTLTWAELQVRLLCGSEGEEAVLAYLDQALEQPVRRHNVRQTIRLSALKATALAAGGNFDRALPVLEETVRRARPNSLVRTLVSCGPPMHDLLRWSADRHPEDAYLRALVEACPAASHTDQRAQRSVTVGIGSGTAPTDLEMELSNREIDVLLLLGERLTNKEIASRLFVSPETVKKHTLSIYRKLGVHRRREAVKIGISTGVIPAQ